VVRARDWAGNGRQQVIACLEMLNGLVIAREKNQPAPRGTGCGVQSLRSVLSTTSRSTAEATGALGHMSYAEVKRYAAAYEFQATVSHTFERLGDHYSEVLKFFKVDFMQLGLDELKEVRANFLTYALLLDTVHDQTETLLQFYDNALARR
jgi:hypothetical protein